MYEAQKKVSLAIQKKEQELAELKEKEKQINKKIAEKEKKALEIRMKKLGRMMEEILKKKFGDNYIETKSMEEIQAYLNQIIDAEEHDPETLHSSSSLPAPAKRAEEDM